MRYITWDGVKEIQVIDHDAFYLQINIKKEQLNINSIPTLFQLPEQMPMPDTISNSLVKISMLLSIVPRN